MCVSNREHEVKERDRSRKKGAGVLVNSYSDMGITHEAAVNILSHSTVEKKSCLMLNALIVTTFISLKTQLRTSIFKLHIFLLYTSNI